MTWTNVELRMIALSEHPDVPATVDGYLSIARELGIGTRALEEFWVFATDGNTVRKVHMIARGDHHSVRVPIPAVLAVPVLAGAHRVILLHTHTSGRLLPSRHDYDLTETLVEVMNKAGMTVDDHLIVAPDGRYLSFREAHVLTVPVEAPVPMEVRA